MMDILPGDYYMDGGLLVFTEQYLRRRGYCCGSGCRHCPYGPEVVEKEAGTSDEGEAGSRSSAA